MADQKLTDRTALTILSIGDKMHIVDASDLTDGAEGTSKEMDYGLLKSTLQDDLDINLVTTTTTLLEINVKEFVMHINGADVTFATETLTLPNNETSYIGYDLTDNHNIHFLRRDYQDGMIWVAKVTTDGTGVTNIEQINPELPLDKCYNFYDKLNNSIKGVNVAIIGDSIGEGGTGGYISWHEQLFDVANVAYGNNIPSISSASYDNFSSGGQTSHYGALWTGRATRGGSGNYNGTGISYDNITQGSFFTYGNFEILKDTPINNNDYDLVIILFNVNGGEHKFAHLENMVKNLRGNGIDVIVCTENFRSTDLELYFTDGDIIKSITERYGSSFSDTWAFMRESEYKGVSTLHDTVHPNQAGHTVYGQSFRTILNGVKQNKGIQEVNTNRTVKYPDQVSLAKNFPNYYEIDCLPHDNSGTLINSSANDLVNPAMRFNSADKTLSLIELEVGETAKFSHAYPSGYDIIIDGSSVAEFSWYSQNGATLRGSSVHNTNQGNRPEIIEGQQSGAYTSITGNLMGNSGIQVTCTSGTLKLYGLLWHVYKSDLIPFKNLDFVGTWGEESEDYSHPNSAYTDTIGDTFTFKYKGSGATIFLSRESAAGIVDIYLNGEIFMADLDLYSTGTFIKTLYITHAESDYYDDILHSKNTVTVHLKGVNGSAITPVATNRRLGVIMVKEFDRR